MKTKIDERREREEFDRQNPWQPMASAPGDGTACDLLFSDISGPYSIEGARFFLEGSDWFRIEPPQALRKSAMNWRAFGGKVDPAKRAEIIVAATKRDF